MDSIPLKRHIASRREWLKSIGLLGAATFTSPFPNLVAADRESSATNIGSRRELFVEDALIERVTGAAQLRLHHPVPREVALVHDAPWEGSGSGYHTVIKDGDRYRLYYRGLHLDVSKGKMSTSRHQPYYCYAESKDGIRWTKPNLGIVDYKGSKANNIILEGTGTHNFAPFKDANPDCAPDARFKALAGIKQEGGLFAFKSPDGIHWSMIGDKPLITNGAFDSQNIGFWDPTLGKYRAYWRTFTAGVTEQKVWKPSGYRAIRTGTSKDFINWSNEADLTYVDSPAEHLYTNQVAPYPRAPHLLIGIPTRYVDRGWSDSARALPDLENRELRASASERYGTAVTEALIMASRDGVHFKRWNEAFIRPGISRKGTWQYGQNYVAHNFVETKSTLPGAPDELSFYSTEDYWHGSGGKLRRYTLRNDGFVSVKASTKGGELVTKPFVFSGKMLTMNFATSAVGDIRVEIQHADGKAIPGFALKDCPAHFGDTLERIVGWIGGIDVSKLAGKPIRLRFVLKDADLYSYWFRS